MATFMLEIVTPDGLVYEGPVEHVRAPGAEGSFGVLAGHTPFMTTLAMGAMFVRTEDKKETLYATSGGIAEVTTENMRILAETAERADAIDTERAEASKERAEKRLSEHSDDMDVDRARLALMRAINRLKVAGM